MNVLFRSQTECLKKEMVHYQILIELAQIQKDLLVAGKVEPLTENTRLEEKEVFALGPLVAERKELLAKMAIDFHVKDLGLDEAVQRCPVDEVEDFKKAVIELVQSAKRLEEISRGNDKLLNNALTFANFTLRVINDGGKKKNYVPKATLKEENRPQFVNRVI